MVEIKKKYINIDINIQYLCKNIVTFLFITCSVIFVNFVELSCIKYSMYKCEINLMRPYLQGCKQRKLQSKNMQTVSKGSFGEHAH